MGHDILFQAFIYLAAAVVSVPLAKRFGMGSVLGYLLAGMILGPDGFNLLGDRSRDVMKFAEFGVVMMLFLVGLELRPKVMWSLRVPLLGMGGAQVLVSALVLGSAALAFGLTLKASLAAGLILAMSSTALVLQSLAERKRLKTPGGQASFSVLLFQDMAVIPILAILPLLAVHAPASGGVAHGVARFPAWQQALLVLAAVTGIVFGGRFLMRPVFRAVARTGLREVFSMLALVLVVGIALLMESVGMSPALGAFLAGVVLADNEYRHELEGDIEPFKGILLALFFIAVGAGVDFGFIRNHIPFTVLGVLGVLALKFGVLFAVARAFRLEGGASLLFAGALCQVGEFAFVLLSLAGQQGVLGADEIRPLTVIVALSMVLTPLLLALVDRITRARLGSGKPQGADAIEASEAPVLIAGYGRVGRMVGRILRANGIRASVLEIDADQVAHARKVGLEAWYGDASRLDLLHAAGAEKAKLLVLAIDDPEVALALADAVRLHYPHLRLVVRARDHIDAYAFFKRGIDDVHRETFGSAMAMGEAALKALGHGPHKAHRSILAWKKHNEAALRELSRHWGDDQSYFDQLRATIRGEEGMLDAGDAMDPEIERAWDNSTLREEVRARSKAT